MISSKLIQSPGDHPLLLRGAIGPLESILTIPKEMDQRFIAILGHPHSLQGGTMDNKVVTTLARTFEALHIASLRFNFRGVGESVGCYDEGIGESEDMLLIAQAFLKEMPQAQIIFAGFSFGSYVAYRAAAQSPHALLISIAPPVNHYDYNGFSPPPSPWLVVQGDEDELISFEETKAFFKEHYPTVNVLCFPETSHFFHGKLVMLKERLKESIMQLGILNVTS